MLTADTITDEQIRELRRILRSELDATATTVTKFWESDRICALALGTRRDRLIRKHEARARCAEILNARKESDA